MDINPHNDGIDHINIYSKGKTKIGRDLSNFSYTPFNHKKYGLFNSVEGLWYYLITNCQYEEFRNLYGYKAKEEGKKRIKELGHDNLESDILDTQFFIENIKEGIRQKLRDNRNILIDLVNTGDIPLKHYYVYYSNNDKNKYTIRGSNSYPWVIEEIDRIRKISIDFLNRK